MEAWRLRRACSPDLFPTQIAVLRSHRLLTKAPLASFLAHVAHPALVCHAPSPWKTNRETIFFFVLTSFFAQRSVQRPQDEVLRGAPIAQSQASCFVHEQPRYESSHACLSRANRILSLEGSSRDEPTRLFPCPECRVRCRRPYDVVRHYQTKHTQSEHWFCPVQTCDLSYNVDHLGENLQVDDLRYYESRYPLSEKSLRTDAALGYSKTQLNGFPRRDKLLTHFKKNHKVRESCACLIRTLTSSSWHLG